MNMDGSQAEIIDPPSFRKEVSTGKIGIDRHSKMILVSSQVEQKIFGINYEGKLVGTIVELQNGTFSISPTKKELIWVNKLYCEYNLLSNLKINYIENKPLDFLLKKDRQGESFIDGSVFKCDYDGKRCLPNTTFKLHEGYSGGHVKALSAVVEPPPPDNQLLHSDISKICESCQQFCILDRANKNANNGQCVCGTGWRRSKEDSNKCERIEDFLIIENSKVVRGVCPDRLEGFEGRCEALNPLQIDLGISEGEQTGFDYDSTTRCLNIYIKNF